MKTHAANTFIWIIAIGVTTIAALAGQIESQTAETTIACDEREVRYKPFDSSYSNKVTLSEIEDSSDLHVEKTKKQSPQGTRYFLLQNPDFSRPGPWRTTVLIGGVGLNKRPLKISLIDHANGGAQVHWLNEKLLFVEVWWGRIVSSDLILDVNSRAFLYKEMAEYGDVIQPCH